MAAPRVLLVDADAETRTILRVALEHFGFAVQEAATAETALDAAVRDVPDVVITELWVPGSRGACVLSAVLHRDARTDRARVIVLTTRAQPGDLDVARRSGADRVFAKPADLAQVLDAVRALCRPSSLGAPYAWPTEIGEPRDRVLPLQ